MLHLTLKNGKYHVNGISPNHEVVTSAQPRGFTTRKGAFKNIRASATMFDAKVGYSIPVQDDTGAEARILMVTETSIEPTNQKPGRKYEPSKHKSPGRKATNRKTAAPQVSKLPSKKSASTRKRTTPKKAKSK